MSHESLKKYTNFMCPTYPVFTGQVTHCFVTIIKGGFRGCMGAEASPPSKTSLYINLLARKIAEATVQV